MPWARYLESILFVPEIEQTLTQICKENSTMTEPQLDETYKVLRDYAIHRWHNLKYMKVGHSSRNFWDQTGHHTNDTTISPI